MSGGRFFPALIMRFFECSRPLSFLNSFLFPCAPPSACKPTRLRRIFHSNAAYLGILDAAFLAEQHSLIPVKHRFPSAFIIFSVPVIRISSILRSSPSLRPLFLFLLQFFCLPLVPRFFLHTHLRTQPTTFQPHCINRLGVYLPQHPPHRGCGRSFPLAATTLTPPPLYAKRCCCRASAYVLAGLDFRAPTLCFSAGRLASHRALTQMTR